MQRQLCVQRADLFTIAVGCDCYGTVGVAKLRCFQQRQCRDGFSCGKLESVGNECIVLVAANLNFVGVRFAVVDELSLYGLFSDQSI